MARKLGQLLSETARLAMSLCSFVIRIFRKWLNKSPMADKALSTLDLTKRKVNRGFLAKHKASERPLWRKLDIVLININAGIIGLITNRKWLYIGHVSILIKTSSDKQKSFVPILFFCHWLSRFYVYLTFQIKLWGKIHFLQFSSFFLSTPHSS